MASNWWGAIMQMQWPATGRGEGGAMTEKTMASNWQGAMTEAMASNWQGQ